MRACHQFPTKIRRHSRLTLLEVKSSEIIVHNASSGKDIIVPTQCISYFEVTENYLKLHYAEDAFLLFLCPMIKMESCLAGSQFVRVHRSFMVNMNFCAELGVNFRNEAVKKSGVGGGGYIDQKIQINEQGRQLAEPVIVRLPVGRLYRERLRPFVK